MLQLQWKLLGSSHIRKVLLVALAGCCLWNHIRILICYFQGMSFSAIGGIYFEASLFIYYFILILFLAYDYFRELPDAEALEMLKSSTHYVHHDLSQFGVFVIIIGIYTTLFLVLNLVSNLYAGVVTTQVLLFYVKEAAIYLIFNGFVAVLLAWLLSRCVGKIMGYIILMLFACFVSPIIVSKLEYYVLWARGIFEWFRVFLIMPQGLDSFFDYTILPVNLTIASRSIFWIGFFVTCLTLCYFRNIMKGIKWTILTFGVAISIWALVYSGLPASFYSNNNSLGAQDSVNYAQWSYEINEDFEQIASESQFEACAYDIKLKLTRLLEADVTIYPNATDLDTYEMTLYHAYRIEQVTDENGMELEYYREGDYLTIFNTGELESIRIQYQGACANFYANRNEVNLPGWFPYYPVPGFRILYQDYQYVNNTLATEAEFDVQIQANATIYSDLDSVDVNHFHGYSTGPSFLAGFVKEEELPGGVRYVYPYLDAYCIPDFDAKYSRTGTDLEEIQESYEYVADKLMMQDNKITTILVMPNLAGDGSYIYDGTKIVDHVNWFSLKRSYERTNEFSKKYLELNTVTEEDMIGVVQTLYYDFKNTFDKEELYHLVFDMYIRHMGEFGYTEDEFESFITEYLGVEEWKFLEECRDYVED